MREFVEYAIISEKGGAKWAYLQMPGLQGGCTGGRLTSEATPENRRFFGVLPEIDRREKTLWVLKTY